MDQEVLNPILQSVIGQWGAMGLLVIVLLVFIYMFYKHLEKKDAEHSAEIKASRNDMKEIALQQTKVTEKNTEALFELKNVVDKLSTIINNH